MYNTDNPIRVDSQSQKTPPNFLHLHKIHPAVRLYADICTVLPLSLQHQITMSSFAGVQSREDVLDFKQPSRAQEEAKPDREDAAVCIRHSFGDPVKAVWVLQAVNIHMVNEDDLVLLKAVHSINWKKNHKVEKSGFAHKRLPVVEPCGPFACFPVVFQHLNNSMIDSDDRDVNAE